MLIQTHEHGGLDYTFLIVKKALSKPQYAKAILLAAKKVFGEICRVAAPSRAQLTRLAGRYVNVVPLHTLGEALWDDLLATYNLIRDVCSRTDYRDCHYPVMRGALNFHHHLYYLHDRDSFRFQVLLMGRDDGRAMLEQTQSVEAQEESVEAPEESDEFAMVDVDEDQ